MKKVSWLCSTALLAGLAIGITGLVGCGVQDEDPASDQAQGSEQQAQLPEASSPATQLGFQTVYVCFYPEDVQVGPPRGTLAACQAACPVGGYCQPCKWWLGGQATSCD